MEKTFSDSWKAVLTGESLLFSLLGKALYEEPDQSWLESLISKGIFDEPPFGGEVTEIQQGMEILRRWSEKNRAGIPGTEFDRIKQDHVRLFIGVGKIPAPPWESVYFSEKRLIFQEQTLQVREWYARFGLQLERVNHEPDDQVGLEMLFVAHLAIEAAKAINEDKQETFAELLQAQRDFLQEHLLLWGPVWAKNVKKEAGTDFYRGLAYLTHGALIAATEQLEITLPREICFESA